MKTFATERAARAYADDFAYARSLCRLEPLIVARLADGSGYGVFNSDYPSTYYRFDDRGRLVRRDQGVK